MKELIHFVHGNGFPSLCYSQFLQNLDQKYDYCFIDKVGHNPDYPVTDNWHHLVDEVLQSVERQSDKPVIGIGHSLGAVLSLFAAIKKPALFKAVIMLDAPLLGPFKSSMVHLAKKLGLIDKITPAGQTKGRRQHWKTHEELIDYLQNRPLFKTFTTQCLEDYITYGFQKDKDGYHLLFDPDIEYNIYRTLPHMLPFPTKNLPVPVSLIYGDKSRVVTQYDRKWMALKFGIKIYSVPGTHLFPFEIPREAAEKVIDIL